MEELSQKKIEEILAYHQNALSPQEREAFEKEMEENERFRESVISYQDVLGGLEELKLQALGEKYAYLKEDRSKRFKSSPGKKGNFGVTFVLLAASLVILMGCTYFFYIVPKYSRKSILSKYDSSSTRLLNFRSAKSGNSSEKLLSDSEIIKRALAGSLTDSLLSLGIGDPNYSEAQFLLGHYFFKKGEFNKAKEAFRTVLSSGNKKLSVDAHRNLVFSYIGNDETDLPEFLELFEENTIPLEGTPSYRSELENWQQITKSSWFDWVN